MKYILIVFLQVLFMIVTCTGQTPDFISEGRIEFEKKVNLYSQFNEDDSWTAEFKKRIPQFKITYFDLFFNESKTLYKPGREIIENNRLWEQPAEDNIVFTDLKKNETFSQKRVFENIFLIQDSIRNIHWKLTDEKRMIAGFECRRANALILDSIYVVAFYTDEIAISGGPESFSSLPGMILGVAIPHEHVTWFATKLTLEPAKEADFTLPKLGIKIKYSALKDVIKNSSKMAGKNLDKFVKAALL